MTDVPNPNPPKMRAAFVRASADRTIHKGIENTSPWLNRDGQEWWCSANAACGKGLRISRWVPVLLTERDVRVWGKGLDLCPTCFGKDTVVRDVKLQDWFQRMLAGPMGHEAWLSWKAEATAR